MQQNDTEQPAVGIGREIPDIQDNEYRLISAKNLSSVLTEIHGCKEGIYLLMFVYDNAFVFHILIYTYMNFVLLVTKLSMLSLLANNTKFIYVYTSVKNLGFNCCF